MTFVLDGEIETTTCGNRKSCLNTCGKLRTSSINMKQDGKGCLTVILDDGDPKEQAELICKALISQNSSYCYNLPNGTFSIQDVINCPTGWTYFSGTQMCFKYIEELLTWEEAEKNCQRQVESDYKM